MLVKTRTKEFHTAWFEIVIAKVAHVTGVVRMAFFTFYTSRIEHLDTGTRSGGVYLELVGGGTSCRYSEQQDNGDVLDGRALRRERTPVEEFAASLITA